MEKSFVKIEKRNKDLTCIPTNKVVITTNTDLLKDLDIIKNKCQDIENYPLIPCHQCQRDLHISMYIGNWGLCYDCDEKLYKKYDYNSKLVEKERKQINLDKYHCQKCKLIDQTVPGGPLFFGKIGNSHFNYCNKCLFVI